MTIPFGRRRFVLTMQVLNSAPFLWEGRDPLGANDAELARFNDRRLRDVEQVRWEAQTLLYGGHR